MTLASVDGVGDETFALLLATFGSASDVLAAALDDRLRNWIADRRAADGRPPINGPTTARLVEAASEPESRLGALADFELWTLTPLDAGYPPRLRDLDPPPPVINGWGDESGLGRDRAVAVVGTRRPTPAGRVLTNRICGRLVESGAVVISGLAVGIDGAAHAATVDREGCTVAVLGAGHGQPGPRAHGSLRRRILAAGGAVISQHHPTTGARKGTFPKRNRIIAALGDAVIVVEAPVRSGALITARHGLELGRLVLVAPGRVGDWATAGSLSLLRDTPARPLVGLDEMTEDLGSFAPTEEPAQSTVTDPRAMEPALAMLGPAERAVAKRLCVGPAGLDLLVADTGLAPGVTSSAVTMLLMRGWIQSIGPAYVAAGPLAR